MIYSTFKLLKYPSIASIRAFPTPPLRAFLDTISEKIATTFEATDASLLKLVRIQQADSTAARLGMESALTAFLNNMYETTEYMTEAADSIRASIYEASALMTAEEATDFEYQVQK